MKKALSAHQVISIILLLRCHDEVFQFLFEHVKGRERFTAIAIAHAINSGQSNLDELLSNLNVTHGVITELVTTRLVKEEGRCGHMYVSTAT